MSPATLSRNTFRVSMMAEAKPRGHILNALDTIKISSVPGIKEKKRVF